MRSSCFLALTRPVSMAGLPMNYIVLMSMVVFGGYIGTGSLLYLLGSGVVSYVTLRSLAAYDPRILDVIFVGLSRTPMPTSWFRGKGISYRD